MPKTKRFVTSKSKMKTLRQPPDYPATFKEAEHLKVIYLKFAA